MDGASKTARLPFLLVVVFCLLQIAWWVYFGYEQSGRIERAERHRLDARCLDALLAFESILDRGETDAGAASDFAKLCDERFPELELVRPAPGERQGVRLALLLDNLPPRAADLHIRPRDDALASIVAESEGKRRMFWTEGLSLTAVILFGVFVLNASLERELDMRSQHERFLAGATHELKTPLATIRLGLQTLSRQVGGSGERTRFVEPLVGQVDRVSMQIENLLRVAAGKARTLSLAAGDLASDLRDVAEEMRPRLASRDVVLDLEITADKVPVRRDEEALKQVLRNLIDNALKFSPPGEAIRVSLESDASEARLRVADAGPGVATPDRARIFEKLYRGRAQPEEGRGGSGLGLYLARRTALAHGGELRLSEDDGRAAGACFELSVPLAAEARAT